MNGLKQKIAIFLFCCFAIFLGIYTGRNFDPLFSALTNKSISSNIFYSSFDENNYYSVISSRREAVILDKSGVCENIIMPSTDFSACINGILPDASGSSLYIWYTYFDETGSYIALEEIARYSVDGKFEKVLHSINYSSDDAVAVSGRIRGITILENGNLGVAVAQSDSILTLEIANGTNYPVRTVSYDCENASHIVFDVFLGNGISDIYFSTKQGKILKAQEGKPTETVFDTGSEGIFVPSKIYQLHDESLLVKESFTHSVVKISKDGSMETLIGAEAVGLEEITSFYTDGNSLIISDNYQILQCAIKDGRLIYTNSVEKLKYGYWNYAKSYILFTLVVITIGIIFYLAGRIIQNLSIDNKQIFRQIVIICISLSITVGIISFYVFNALDGRTLEANYNLLNIHLEYLSEIIDSERVENMNSVSQFDSADFNTLIEQLNQSLTVMGEQDHSKYVGILKNIDDKIVIISYHDMDEFFFTPVFYEYQLNGTYLPAFEEGQIVRNVSVDAEGRWQYVFGPIYNEAGEIIAVAEIGFDLTPYEQANNSLFTDLLLRLVSILVTILLLFTEYTIYESTVINKKTLADKSADDIESISCGSVRAVSVLLFVGTYLNCTFMPVYSSNLYSDILGLPKDIVIAMPIVTETLFLIISILLFGRFRKEIGFKQTIALGGVLHALGSVLTALSADTTNLILSRAVVGIGYGIVYISLRAYIAHSNKPTSEELIAYGAGMACGVSVGGILGSVFADFIGFRNTFFIVAFIMLVASFVAWRILDSRRSAVREQNIKKHSGVKFLFNKDIVIYYIFEFMPAAICGSFSLYFLPLIAERLGYTTAFVGQIFLINALFAIYSGPSLTRITSKYLGAKNSLVVAGLLFSGAILLVAFNTESIVIVSATAIIIGFVESFKENQESDYFLGLRACNEVGNTRAVTYFGLFECTGELIGPIIYAFILSLGTSQGLMILGVVLAVSLSIFKMIGSKPG